MRRVRACTSCGRWLSRATRARSRSNSATVPTSRPSAVWPVGALGLHERALGDLHEAVGEGGVEVGLRHVELHLGARARHADLGAAARGLAGADPRDDAAAGEQRLRAGDAEDDVVRVREGGEHAAERVAALAARLGAGERRGALLGGGVGADERRAELRGRRRVGRDRRRVGALQRLELVLELLLVGGARADLRQPLGARLGELPARALQPRLGDAHALRAAHGEGEGVLERQRARGACPAGGRRRLRGERGGGHGGQHGGGEQQGERGERPPHTAAGRGKAGHGLGFVMVRGDRGRFARDGVDGRSGRALGRRQPTTCRKSRT
jgi:hypothetical protein